MFASPQISLLQERGLLVYTQWLISLLFEVGQRNEVKEQEKKTG